uniref:URB1 C-terminal domain-containing protein n=1 Tax=Leptocylindrus danicus TaxID=163516 RepID=A0A7S2LSX0_9STRA|mmetsp:Transcript_9323/g.14026  ORF Transcript_9323/g.14026 Transcript_9323/m.14026 type:complete len:1285 (+) Transcript_9323:168-4022(+)
MGSFATLQKAVKKYSSGFRNMVARVEDRSESMHDNEQDRLLIAFAGTSTQYLPNEDRAGILLVLLESSFASLSAGNSKTWNLAMLLSILRTTAVDSSSLTNSFHVSSIERQLFVVSWKLWMMAVPMIDQDPVILSLIPLLERYLIGFLQCDRKNGSVASIILDESRNMEPAKVVDICITAIVADKRSSLLSHLLRIDCCVFGPFLLRQIAEKKTSAIKLLNEGAFDGPLDALFENAKMQQCTKTCDKDEFHSAFELIVDYATNKMGLNNPANGDECSKLIRLLPTIYFFSSTTDKVQLKILSWMTAVLTTLVNKSRSKPNLEMECALFDASFVLQQSNTGIQNDQTSSQKELRSFLLVNLCIILPRSLRKRGQRKPCGKPVEHDPEDILGKLIFILSSKEELENKMFLSQTKTITNAIVSCLKKGVVSEDDVVSASCLRVTRAFLTAAQVSLPLYELASTEDSIFKVSHIYSMITSHSQFSAALHSVGRNPSVNERNESGEKRDIVNAKNESINNAGIELLQLILYCVSMGKGSILIDDETRRSILVAYNGGTRTSDRYIRRILFLNEANTLEKNEEYDSMPYSDAIGWGSETAALNANGHSEANNEWNWFMSYLESRRVRLTLIQIPFSEELVPAPEVDVEIWENDDSSDVDASSGSEGDGADNSSDTDTSSEHSGSKRKSPTNSKNVKYKRYSTSVDDWIGSSEDQRYSLSGIVPLILGALEAHVPTEPEEDNHIEQENTPGHHHGGDISEEESTMESYGMPLQDQQDEDSGRDVQYESYAEIARRLSDRGAIALCIAALSCKCPEMRKVAVAALGLFLRAIHSKAAHNSSKWNVRPQLEMLLNSVQRGLALRRAVYTEANDANNRIFVPLLPPVTALFIARASLILSRPGDHLYPAINGYFLRIADNHGAFKEVNGLPGFMSLYCSSDANHEYNKEERIWALQLLKDGVKDGYSFRIISKKHVPSLLLTSFEILSVHGSENCGEGERKFILETIQSMLENCGPIASTHLLMRVGILSWLKGFLVGDNFSKSLPTVFLRRSFLDLCSTAVRCSFLLNIDEADKTSLMIDASELAGPLVSLCAETIIEIENDENVSEKSEAFLKAVCNFFHNFGKGPFSLNEMDSMSNSGLVLKDSVTVISFVQKWDHMLAYDLVHALAALPVATYDTDIVTSKEYIAMILQIFLEYKRDDVELASQNNILKHATSLARFFGNDLVDNGIVKSILACRRLSLLAPDGHNVWIECLKAMLGQHDDEQEETAMEIDSDEVAVVDTRKKIILPSAW